MRGAGQAPREPCKVSCGPPVGEAAGPEAKQLPAHLGSPPVAKALSVATRPA